MTVLPLAFGVVLMLALLLSELARRTVLSTSVMFLGAGLLLGRAALGWVRIDSGAEVIMRFAELSLFTILFVDGAQLELNELKAAARLPGRALLIGMPLTIGFIALACRLLLHVDWISALLVGAILSPTDPVFVSAILEREAVPRRLRQLLRIESGLNDGIALPLVMILISITGHEHAHPVGVALEASFGVALGVAVPALFLWLERRSYLGMAEEYCALSGVAIACVLFGGATLLKVNEFLAAFAGGVTLATLRPDLAQQMRKLGAPLAEALKLATLLVFGALLELEWLFGTGLPGFAFAALALLLARPAALVLAFVGQGLERKEWLAAAWFGPKGFASLLYAIIMLHRGLPEGEHLFQVIALVIVLSIVAHSSTDVPVIRAFARTAESKQS